MKRLGDSSTQWIFYLVAGCFYGAVFLRSFLRFPDSPELPQILGLQLMIMALSASESTISRRWKNYFLVYIVFEIILIIYLLTMPESADFFAILFVIPTMQMMLRLDQRMGWIWIGTCALLMGFIFYKYFGTQVVAVAVVNTAANIFFGSYALTTRRAQVAQVKNKTLVQELEAANSQLEDYLTQLEQLAVARERNRLARELHDSVTQTVFSMNLTAQTALLLFERDPGQLEPQLERLTQLAQSTLSEMQILIAELRPEKNYQGDLVFALRKHIEDRQLQQDLSVSLQVEGSQPLNFIEEQGLFRIAQEALNNVVKHSQTNQALIRLHLSEPFWMEIADQGQGFQLDKVLGQGRIGLHSMEERAEEIGWDLRIFSFPGAGTRIRVEKSPEKGW
jgi:signal transduction histidine kinase